MGGSKNYRKDHYMDINLYFIEPPLNLNNAKWDTPFQ